MYRRLCQRDEPEDVCSLECCVLKIPSALGSSGSRNFRVKPTSLGRYEATSLPDMGRLTINVLEQPRTHKSITEFVLVAASEAGANTFDEEAISRE